MESKRRTHIAEQAAELAKTARIEGLDFLGYLLDMAAHEAVTPGDHDTRPDGPGAFADSDYLRDQAARCMRMARDHRGSPISHDLETIGVELMEKAGELDRYLAGKERAEARR